MFVAGYVGVGHDTQVGVYFLLVLRLVARCDMGVFVLRFAGPLVCCGRLCLLLLEAMVHVPFSERWWAWEVAYCVLAFLTGVLPVVW